MFLTIPLISEILTLPSQNPILKTKERILKHDHDDDYDDDDDYREERGMCKKADDDYFMTSEAISCGFSGSYFDEGYSPDCYEILDCYTECENDLDCGFFNLGSCCLKGEMEFLGIEIRLNGGRGLCISKELEDTFE